MILKKYTKKDIFNFKNLLIFTISLLIIGLLCGIIFYIFIKDTDKSTAKKIIESYFLMEDPSISFISNLKLSLGNNISSVLLIWLLGISIIGIIFILFILFIKGFTTGFSISTIFDQYKLMGIIGNFFYLIPNRIISLFLFIYLGYYSLYFGINLFLFLFLKKEKDMHLLFKNYFKKLIISLIMAIVISLLEVFISPLVFKIFTILSK